MLEFRDLTKQELELSSDFTFGFTPYNYDDAPDLFTNEDLETNGIIYRLKQHEEHTFSRSEVEEL